MKRHHRKRDTGVPSNLRPERSAGKLLAILDSVDAEAGREPLKIADHEKARRELDALTEPKPLRTL